MNIYESFETEDFLCDDFFIAWVLCPHDEHLIFWEEWLSKHPDRVEVVFRAKKIISSVKITPVNDNLTDSEVLQLISRIQRDASKISENAYKKTSSSVFWYSTAAVFFAIFFAGFFYNKTRNSPNRVNSDQFTDIGFVNVHNSSGYAMLIRLKDSSLSLLAPNSTLRYPVKFDGSPREVYLDGEAFFEVHKNPNRPFLVHTENMAVRVLGTSFRVRAFKREKKFSVVVSTGKVRVYLESKQRHNQSNYVLLSPNQYTLYTRATAEFKIDTVKSRQLLSHEVSLKEFTFHDTPFADIIKKLDLAYNVHITYDTVKMKGISLNASLSDQPLDEKIRLITKAINGECDFSGGQIIIKSNN